jgi:hypothetical protein
MLRPEQHEVKDSEELSEIEKDMIADAQEEISGSESMTEYSDSEGE